jgi:hypothetical protein
MNLNLILSLINPITFVVIPAREPESTSIVTPRGSRVAARDDGWEVVS